LLAPRLRFYLLHANLKYLRWDAYPDKILYYLNHDDLIARLRKCKQIDKDLKHVGVSNSLNHS
jgi:hypothetical protein